jgi:hypothetical protein
LEQAMYKAVAEREKLLRRTGAGDRLRSSATIANAENSALAMDDGLSHKAPHLRLWCVQGFAGTAASPRLPKSDV